VGLVAEVVVAWRGVVQQWLQEQQFLFGLSAANNKTVKLQAPSRIKSFISFPDWVGL
jgi:hypothetical protein